MKKKDQLTQYIRSLTLTLLFSLLFSVAALAAEKFVLSASYGPNLILRTFELDQNQIKTVDSNLIDTGADRSINDWDGVINTAVTFRKDNDSITFDVYYTACKENDLDCYWNRTVSMVRLDSDLQVRLAQHFSIPVYDLATIRLLDSSGISLRLLVHKERGALEERILDTQGIPSSAHKIAPLEKLNPNPAVSEDGKMLVTLSGHHFTVRSLHAEVAIINKTKTKFRVAALSLSGPVARSSQEAGSRSRSDRFLFFQTYDNFPDAEGSTNIKSRIMRQRIDELTGKFIGRPKALTQYIVIPWRPYGPSVAVTPGANVVFFTEYDASCNRHPLWAQVFNPQTRTKVGSPQLLIGCSELLSSVASDINGIDVAQFEP